MLSLQTGILSSYSAPTSLTLESNVAFVGIVEKVKENYHSKPGVGVTASKSIIPQKFQMAKQFPAKMT